MPIPALVPPQALMGVLMSGPFRGQTATVQPTGMLTWQQSQPTPATIDMGAPDFWADSDTPVTQGISFDSDGYSFDTSDSFDPSIDDVQFEPEPEPEGARRRQYEGPGTRRQASRTVVTDRGVGGGGAVVSQLNPATGRFEQLPRQAIRRNDNPPAPIYPRYTPEPVDINAHTKMIRQASPQPASDLSRCATDLILEF